MINVETAKSDVMTRVWTQDLTVVCEFNFSRLSLHLRPKTTYHIYQLTVGLYISWPLRPYACHHGEPLPSIFPPPFITRSSICENWIHDLWLLSFHFQLSMSFGSMIFSLSYQHKKYVIHIKHNNVTVKVIKGKKPNILKKEKTLIF